MPHSDPEKRRTYQLEYRKKNREKLARQHKENYQKNIEERRRANRVYNATHKELRGTYRDSHKEERVAYYKKNKEELNRKNREYYIKNREAVIKRTTKYHFENKEWREKYYEEYYQKIRLEVLARIDPDMKCSMCGCDDTRFLEINHIKGGGNKEHHEYSKEGNLILRIYKDKRGLEDLNLLCRACNSLDHLERVYGKTGLSVVWDKKEN